MTLFADPRAVFGVALLVVQIVLAWPVIARIHRGRSGLGISLTGEAIWVVAGVGWVVYGAVSGSVALIASGSIAAVTSCLTVGALWSLVPEQRKSALIVSAGTLLGFVAGVLLAGWAGLSVALSVFGVVQFIPQLRQSVLAFHRRAVTSGVSVAGASLRAVYAAGWAVYGGAWWLWGVGVDWPLALWGAAGAVTFALQAVVAARSRRRPAFGDEQYD